jgi:hypothetical protein
MLVEPNGDLAGISGGAGSENVRVCAECHLKAGPERDYLYAMPAGARRAE